MQRSLHSAPEATAMSDYVRSLVNASLLFGAINPEVGLAYAKLAFQAQAAEVVS